MGWTSAGGLLAHQFRVQGTSGFIEEHQLGAHDKYPGDGHTLLLPAGQVRRVMVRLVPKPHPLHEPHRTQSGLGLPNPLRPHRRPDDVFQRGHVRNRLKRWNTIPISRHKARGGLT